MEIQTLSPEVVNQIAAGEVVERPAHLVKELVENSLDAGATEVEVELDEGGRQVRVRDNGKGISPEDLALALSRHATSKIHVADDLWHLNTYGFRGEALASISAVSDLSLISRRQGAESAYELKSHYGSLIEPIPVGGEEGTLVWIRDLFANLPARLKFLKSDQAETTQIRNVLKAMALASPEVNFRVRCKESFSTIGQEPVTPLSAANWCWTMNPFTSVKGRRTDLRLRRFLVLLTRWWATIGRYGFLCVAVG